MEPDRVFAGPAPRVPPPPVPVTPQPVRPSAGAIVVTCLWRCLIVAAAFYGLLQGPGDLEFLSQLGSLLAGVYYGLLVFVPLVTAGRRLDEPTAYPRMTMVALMVVITGVVGLLMRNGFSEPWALFEHLITPALVVGDFFLCGRNQACVRLWNVWALPLAPLAYVVFAVAHGGLYHFLDPDDEVFWPLIGGGLVGVLMLGLALYGLGLGYRRRRPYYRPSAAPTRRGAAERDAR